MQLVSQNFNDSFQGKSIVNQANIQTRDHLWKKIQATRFASTESLSARDITARPDINVALANVGGNFYVSIVGRATLVHDRTRAEEMWSPMATMTAFCRALNDSARIVTRVD